MIRCFLFCTVLVFLHACSSEGIKVNEPTTSNTLQKKAIDTTSQDSSGNLILSPVDTVSEAQVMELTTKGGVSIKWKKRGKSEKIQDGDVIKLNYVLMLKSGKIIEDTKAKIGKPIAMVKGIQLGLPGLDTALSYLHTGDIASVTLPGHLGFDEEVRKLLQDTSDLIYVIDVIEKIPAKKVCEGVELYSVYPSTGPKIEKGHEIGMDYFGFLEDGTLFINSRETGEYEFPVGEGRVPSGLDSAILNMHVNDVAWVKLASNMAYGSKGLAGKVPANQNVIYKIQIDYRK